MKVAVFSTLALLAVCGLALADYDYGSSGYGGYGYGLGGYGGGMGGGYGKSYVSYVPYQAGGKGGSSGILGSCKFISCLFKSMGSSQMNSLLPP